MELVKEKYKQTEVGLIPNDWEVKRLGEIFEFKNGLNKEKEFFGYGTPIVNYMDVFRNAGILKADIEGKVFLTQQEIKTYEVKKGDVFFTRTSETVEEIGVSTVVLEDLENTVFSGFVLRGRPKNTTLELTFKKYCFASVLVRKEITTTASYTTRALTNGRLLSNVKIPVPTKAEQTAIATALSDADALISSLEKLIAKKRNIKQGAMQKLLQPKQGWEVKKLGEVVEVLDNLRKPLNDSERQKMKGDIPYCGANGIVGFVDDYVIDDDIILMAEDGGHFDEYKTRPIAYRMKGKCWVNNHAHILKAKMEIDQDFLFYSLVNKNILDFINGGTRAKLNKGELVNILVAVSKSKEDQTLIATILSDMDAEITSLETKLEKYRKVKLGMMQNLLTGKIRLV